MQGHEDLLRLTDAQRLELCQEIREFLIDRVSRTGGHLASNLGTVELSVALETVYDTKTDRLVFDVGHQSYVHKLLTGRQADFDRLRQFGGMAGFPKPGESITDSFVAGHASSSVSIALGMARARTLSGHNHDVVCVIGDGAATGGMAYEGLNDAAESREPMVIILNDNEMSIDKNVGGMAKHLSRLRSKESYLGMKQHYRSFMSKTGVGRFVYRATRAVKDWFKRMVLPTTIFENMGLTYLGPVDGNDVNQLIGLLRLAKGMKTPVLLHVLTKKGKGYAPAEQNPSKFHGIGKFDPATGETLSKGGQTFSGAFGKTMLELAEENNRVCAITAAMPGGTGLLDFKKTYPKRTFDVGIAEEHAVSMAGGLAKQGMVPVVALYSTFLQRSYDMILQDVAMLHLHVVLAVDRAGLVGEDGETHHGIYDIGFLRHAPGMLILCPASCAEQQKMLRWAVQDYNGPVAIRYPRGGDRSFEGCNWSPSAEIATTGALACHRMGDDVTLISYGTLLENTMQAAEKLAQQGIEATVLRLLTVEPLPVYNILTMMSDTPHVVILEEAAGGCGIREALAWELHHLKPGIQVDGIDLGHQFITHGDMNSLYQHYGLDADSIVKFVQEVRPHEN
ncbi:MAG: 1-deoxy-D-xylulose-5-phosphate synthase [Oscillospiraceae bacterium]|nr:1-deoxy-D-xylulose-5-phosphate synthase [Oscillospiraceae bacterium]